MLFGKESDETLVEKASSGNAAAWEKLIGRYERKIYNHCLRLTGNREDALDLMQDVFLAVYRNLDKFRKEASFSSWIYRIASNRAIDTFRRKRGVHFFDDVDDNMADGKSGQSPSDCLFRSETNRWIVKLLGRLPLEQRMVMELKFFQSLTFDEIAETMSISSNTAKSRLYAAIRKLQADPEVIHAL